MILTTSWDDGHPADRRLAALLKKYGVAGTFFLPCKNRENRPVLDADSMRELSRDFEIGGHTLDHVDLTTVNRTEAVRQITDGKRQLEYMIGAKIDGFCYPRGHYNQSIRKATVDAGFLYARNIKNFCTNIGPDPFAMPVTIQFFPHKIDVYLKNLVKYGVDIKRTRLCLAAIATTNLADRVRRLIDCCGNDTGIFHLWGHSWEIEEYDLWRELESVLEYLHRMFPREAFVTNLQAVKRG